MACTQRVLSRLRLSNKYEISIATVHEELDRRLAARR